MTEDIIELTLNSPITEEQWDVITDVDFENTDRIWFHTKHGKEVEFVKHIRGRWDDVPHKTVEHGEVVIDGATVRCSVCRHAYKGWHRGMNFCPNCGADMRGAEDD